MEGFSLSPDLLETILTKAKPLGHNAERKRLNLGFGFLYYGLVRAIRPKHVVVIGSGFGFSVVCLALGLKDNDKGRLTFVDPGYSVLRDGPLKTVGGMGKWSREGEAGEHFARFGLEDIVTHYPERSDAFFPRYGERGLPAVDLAFVDGSHAYNDVRHDVLAVLSHTKANAYLLLHDTNIYVRELIGHAGVNKWLKRLKRDKESFEVVNFPFASGVAVLRVLKGGPWTFSEA